MVQLWPGDIFCDVCVCWKNSMGEKDTISGVHVSPGSADALVRSDGKSSFGCLVTFLPKIIKID